MTPMKPEDTRPDVAADTPVFSPVDVSAERFRAWFGASAIVDAQGAPLVVYHGTRNDVRAFSDDFLGAGADQYRNMGDYGDGYYFTMDPQAASGYANREGDGDGQGANVLAVYLAVQNPIASEALFAIDGVQGMLSDPYPGESLRPTLEALGYDGIIVDGGREIVVFRPTQIKSAFGNAGDYSAANPDIRFARDAADALGGQPTSLTLTLFHGSRSRFTEIRPSSRGFYGAGVYLTDDHDAAAEYADSAAGNTEPVVYRADVRMQRPFMFDAPEAVEEPTSHTLAKHLLTGEVLDSTLRLLSRTGEMGRAIQDVLAAQGYDGLVVKVPDSPTEYVAFHADQVTLEPLSTATTVDAMTFEQWFAGSVVRDEDGAPLTLFHGSKSDIHVFEKGRSNFEASSSVLGFFFARDPALASTYASHDFVTGTAAPNVMPVNVALRHPKREPLSRISEIEEVWTVEQAQAYVQALRAQGHDGIVFGDAEYVAFDASQIKSVFHREHYASGEADVRFRRSTDALRDATPEARFAAWLDGSAVVDSAGAPLVVYHGSTADFATFDPGRSDSQSGTGVPHGTFFFSSSPQVASSYGVSWQGDFSATYHDGANVKPAYLSLRKPLRVSAKGENWRELDYKGQTLDINELARLAKASGRYDGVIVSRVRDKGVGHVDDPVATTYIAFHPAQIRNAISGEVMGPEQFDLRFRRDGTAALANDPAGAEAAFDAWFEGSCVVDAMGEPLEVFHGTGVEFYTFDPRFIGERDAGFYGRGFYFTPDLAEAESYAETYAEFLDEDDEAPDHGVTHVVRAYVSLRSPFIWDVSDEAARARTRARLEAFGVRLAELNPWTALTGRERDRFNHAVRAAGHDGVLVLKDMSLDVDLAIPGIAEIVAFHPHQIKSATQNIGTFDPANPDIRFRRDTNPAANQGVVELDLSVPADTYATLHDAKLGDTTIVYGVHVTDGGPVVKISSVRTPVAKRRSGEARRALQEVLRQSDAAGLPVALDASPLDHRTRLDKLVSFYESLGFTVTGERVNRLGDPRMTRAAQSSHLDPAGYWRQRALERWLGRSQIVDEEGVPLVLYHGTAGDFSAFDKRRLGDVTEATDARLGFWFSGHPERANAAAADAQAVTADDAGANVLPVWLRMEEPYHDYGSVYEQLSDPEATAKIIRRARRAGHDGVIFHNSEGGTNYVVFHPEQVKSAIGNVGTFSRSTADIRYRRQEAPARRLSVDLPRSDFARLRPIAEGQAIALVIGKTEKPGGVDPVQQFDARFSGAKLNLFGRVPVSAFIANESGARYDGTVDLARAYDYASRPAQDVPPVIAVIGRRSGKLRILDGGHRLSAARLRGDVDIPVIVRVPADAELAFLPETNTLSDHAPVAKSDGKGIDAQTVRRALEADEYSHHVDIYPTFADTPAYVQAAARSESDRGVKGYWDAKRNKVALVAEYLKSESEARKIARHELIGHFGIERMLGPERTEEVTAMVIAAEKTGNRVVAMLGRRVDRLQPGLNAKRRALEIVAHMAEANMHDQPIMRRVADGMRVFLHHIGFLKADVTDAKLCRLLRDSQRYVRKLRSDHEAVQTAAVPPVPASVAPPANWTPEVKYYGVIGAHENNAELLRAMGVELGPYDYATRRYPARFGRDAKEALSALSTDFDVRATAVHRGAEVGFFSPRHRNAQWLEERLAVLGWQLATDGKTREQGRRLLQERDAVASALAAARQPAHSRSGQQADFAPA